MPAYFFFDVQEITDPQAMDAYRAKVFDVVRKFGGTYRTVGGTVTPLEGSWRPAFPVLIEFASAEAARRWYDSPEYRPLREQRIGATRGDCVLIDAQPR